MFESPHDIIADVKRSSLLFKIAYYVAPLLLWMLLIFLMSTDRGSADVTRPAIGGLLRRLLPNIGNYLTSEQIDRADWNLRKTAHVVEYAILTLLAFRAVAFGNPAFRNRNVVLPFLIGVLYAASDEYHQSYYASRGGKAADVVFDTFGVLLALVLCLWQHCARHLRQTNSR